MRALGWAAFIFAAAVCGVALGIGVLYLAAFLSDLLT